MVAACGKGTSDDMTNRSRLRIRAGELYVALCAVVAFVAIILPNPNALAYYSLFVLTFPVSLIAVEVTYLGGILLFGPRLDGCVARATILAVWLGLTTAQMMTARALFRTRCRKASRL